MILEKNHFYVKGTKFGGIKNFKYKDIQLNLTEISEIDNSVINIYLKGQTDYFGILDTNIDKSIGDNFSYAGKHDGITFMAQLELGDDGIFAWKIQVEPATDIVYAMDVALGDSGNKQRALYASQYIDNRVYDSDNGYVVAMRRTVEQSTGFPFIQVGANKKVVEYATEGYDFYGTKYRENFKIQSLNKLPSRMRNYEHAFIAQKVKNEKEVIFYAKIKENFAEAIEKALTVTIPGFEIKINNPREINGQNFEIINGLTATHEILSTRYAMNSIEEKKGIIYSFFTENYSHVITKEKEILTDRTHASIITSGNHKVDNSMQSVTSNYMCGIFTAQNVISNTALNSLNKNIANGLYLNKLEGMRIFIQKNEQYKMLNLPSYYELGFNYSKWVYLLEDNEITVYVYTEVDTPNINLEIEMQTAEEIVIVDNINENFNLVEGEFKIKEKTLQNEKYPHLRYKYLGDFNFNDQLGLEDSRIVECSFGKVKAAKLKILATTKEDFQIIESEFSTEKEKYLNYLKKLMNNFEIKATNIDIEIWDQLMASVYWYIHNGLIHFATPHGIEQHGGAAWGTRDVCQGPVELFSTFGQYEHVKSILLEVFRNQDFATKNWPQWFMFDNYRHIRASEAHGDIIVWPLKALADYLTETGDIEILDEELPYFNSQEGDFTKEKYTLYQHLLMEIKYIEDNFVAGTALSKYADGDWDDTLQPYHQEDRAKMVSGWTVALTYQAFKAIAPFMREERAKIEKLTENITSDYHKYIIKDGVASGFIKLNNLHDIDYLLHPQDKTTAIKYRLLPMNRGIISSLFTKEEMKNHYELMQTKLKCPDGMRLMDNPAPYHGGINTIFQRAESASTVGREISLQYVHAHIRYIEAACKMNEGADAYEAIKVVNPVIVNEVLPTANLRQRNAYYSSSEGDYDNRYQYAEEFNRLFTGDIIVRSGWRIYSSGPGIYLKQLVSNFLGLKFKNGNIVFEPIELNKDLKLTLNFEGPTKKCEFKINE